jgi:hypothetical protein
VSNFEFVFSLFGLLLGFALVEVLSGFVRATRSWSRESNSELFLTCALGLIVAMDLITFWTVLFGAQRVLPTYTLALFIGFLVAAVYYWAASMIFPAEERPTDLDAHYFRIRRKVIGAILFCNYVTYSAISAASGTLPTIADLSEIAIFTLLCIGVILARSWRTSATALSLLILAYLASAVLRASGRVS